METKSRSEEAAQLKLRPHICPTNHEPLVKQFTLYENNLNIYFNFWSVHQLRREELNSETAGQQWPIGGDLMFSRYFLKTSSRSFLQVFRRV